MIENIVEFLKMKFPEGIQMFNCHAWTGEYLELIYDRGDVRIFYSSYYRYVEIIGVSDAELQQIDSEVNND